MTDLISRADAIEAVRSYFKDRLGKSKCDYDEELQVYVITKEERTMLTYNKGINDKLRSLPSADAVHIETYRELYEKYVELKHASADAVQGEWEKTTDGNGWNEWYVLKCPLCDATIEDKQNRKWEYNYCPNCGARMKGGAE